MTNCFDTPCIGADGLNLGGLRVVVAEDHEFMRNLFTNIFRSLGCHNIRSARNGKEAIDRLDGFGPDLLLTDWVMSPIDGIELTNHVRTSGASANPILPILMVTAFTAQKDIFIARDAGVTEVLAKPVSARSLYAKLRHMILHPRPFIRTSTFFGPDRRRREMRNYTGVERRGNGMHAAAWGLNTTTSVPAADPWALAKDGSRAVASRG